MEDSEYEIDQERYNELNNKMSHLQDLLASKRYYADEEDQLEEDLKVTGEELSSLQIKHKFW